MDEVSSALDELNEKYLNDILDEMKNDKVIIIAAHKLSTIKNADKIILLKDGKVSGEGKYEELINNEFFSDLVRGCGMERER
jgi:entQB